MKRRTNARTILRLEIEIKNLSLSLSRADQSYLIISNGGKRVSGLRNHLVSRIFARNGATIIGKSNSHRIPNVTRDRLRMDSNLSEAYTSLHLCAWIIISCLLLSIREKCIRNAFMLIKTRIIVFILF